MRWIPNLLIDTIQYAAAADIIGDYATASEKFHSTVALMLGFPLESVWRTTFLLFPVVNHSLDMCNSPNGRNILRARSLLRCGTPCDQLTIDLPHRLTIDEVCDVHPHDDEMICHNLMELNCLLHS